MSELFNELFVRVPVLANRQPNLRRIGRYCTTELKLGIDDLSYYLSIVKGRQRHTPCLPAHRGCAFQPASTFDE